MDGINATLCLPHLPTMLLGKLIYYWQQMLFLVFNQLPSFCLQIVNCILCS